MNFVDPDGLAPKKFEKSPNPNRLNESQKKRSGTGTKKGDTGRERQVKPKGGEEHSIKPKGKGVRIPGVRALVCPLCQYYMDGLVDPFAPRFCES